MSKQMPPAFEQLFFDNFKVPESFTNESRGSYEFGEKNWIYMSPDYSTKILCIQLGELSFTITNWKSSKRMAVMFGHDEDAFADEGDEKHMHFDCITKTYDEEDAYFMDSTVRDIPVSYEFMSAVLNFMEAAEDIPVNAN